MQEPRDLHQLVQRAEELATSTKMQLNAHNAIVLADLFHLKHSGRRYIQKEIRDLLIDSYMGANGAVKKGSQAKGLYIFGEEIDGKIVPVYVGISRSIFTRLRQHAYGKKNNESTLAYLKTAARVPEVTRDLYHTDFLTEAEISREKVRNFKVVVHLIEDDYDLYFLEVALAGLLQTKWNSFRTH